MKKRMLDTFEVSSIGMGCMEISHAAGRKFEGRGHHSAGGGTCED